MCLYVRELTAREGRRLTQVLKTAKTATYLRRAQGVAFSGHRDARGRYCPAAASPRGVCAGADSAVQRWRVRGAAPAQAVGPTVEVWAGRHQYDAGGRRHAAARPWAPVHRVVPAEAGDPFGAVRRGQGAACHDARPHPARPGFLVPAHEDLEGESRPRLCRQNNASAPSTGRRRRTPA